MKGGGKLTRMLGAVRHPFFYRHYTDGCCIHPRQALALGELGEFMNKNASKFTLPANGFPEKRLAEFAAAEEISNKPNRTTRMDKLDLEADLRSTAAAHGLSCVIYINHGISDVRISGSYQSLVTAFIGASGAKKGDTLVAGNIGASRMLFTLELDGGRRDRLGMELVGLCAEALGGSVAEYGYSINSMDMILPAKARNGGAPLKIAWL